MGSDRQAVLMLPILSKTTFQQLPLPSLFDDQAFGFIDSMNAVAKENQKKHDFIFLACLFSGVI